MANRGKKYEDSMKSIDPAERYGLDDGVRLVKMTAKAKFDETIDAAFNLNVNPRHAEEMVRGSAVLPHGRGKTTRVLVFAKGEKASEAEAAGADFVGSDEIVAKIEDGWFDFDVAVATPDMMGQVGRIGRLLGPRGLMPNPKSGTVTFEVEKIVNELKSGRLDFRVDKAGIIHLPVGRASFNETQLAENIHAIGEMLARLKPASAKSPYFRSITISATMGPGVKLDTSWAAEMIG